MTDPNVYGENLPKGEGEEPKDGIRETETEEDPSLDGLEVKDGEEGQDSKED
ncbi:hypothetical protein BH11ARM2_BH11ARM2_15040 [soil metagenome]